MEKLNREENALPILLWDPSTRRGSNQHIWEETDWSTRQSGRIHSCRLEIKDEEVIATSGREHHPIARRIGGFNHRVPGTVFEVSEEELANADRYEVSDYTRIETVLASGKSAWVYIEA